MLKDNDIICNKVHRLEMSTNSKIYIYVWCIQAYMYMGYWTWSSQLSQVQNMTVSMVWYYSGIIENYVGKLMHIVQLFELKCEKAMT